VREQRPAGAVPPLLAALLATSAPATEDAPAGGSSPREIFLATPLAARRGLLVAYAGEQVARVLGLPPDAVDGRQRLSDLGLDSLMAVELKNRVESDLGVTLSLVTLLDGPSLDELAAEIDGLLTPATDASRGDADQNPTAGSDADHTASENLPLRSDGPEEAQRLLDGLDGLSDEQVERLLGELLPGGIPRQ
jgi:acyl carrier protein